MSERINLTQLREHAEKRGQVERAPGDYAYGTPDWTTLLALIDTAEAAREFEDSHWAQGDEFATFAEKTKAATDLTRLTTALARFTFDPPDRSHPDPFVQGG